MPDRLIETEADIDEGTAWLSTAEPRFAEALRLTGRPPLRRRPDGFEALMNAIVSQQVSVASARAIWGRVAEAGFADPSAVAGAPDDDLRSCGLSRPKVRYAKALAEADLDYRALRTLPVDEAMAALIAVPGIGRWTAEIYLMFAVGRRDVFAPGDLALQEAAKTLFGLYERPSIPDFDAMAANWSPWRGVAARLLWAYYRVDKGREGVTE